MWTELLALPKWVGGRLVDHDAPDKPTEIVSAGLEQCDGAEFVTIHGKDFDCSYDRRYCGVGGNPPFAVPQGAISIYAQFGMSCTLIPKDAQ